MVVTFRKATLKDVAPIWVILKQAIAKRKQEGSNQWQDGYPNPTVIQKDVEKNVGFVMLVNKTIVGYVAILINDEPAYHNLQGNWLTNRDYVVFHRVAIAKEYLGQGLSKKMMNLIEDYAKQNKIHSIKADTNFDNKAMIALFEQFGYQYCGIVYFRNSPRNAYEKELH